MLTDEQLARFHQANALGAHLGMVVEKAGEEYARVSMELGPAHRNPFGTAHAGAVFALAETAFGTAANMGGRQTVAVSLNISYIRPGVDGRLAAEARLVGRAGPLSTWAVDVTDDQGRTMATAQAVGYTRKQDLAELLP